jgi:two-component system response regulator YesN
MPVYSLLIVDDEPIEREAIRLLVSSAFVDIRIAGEAGNGFEALSLFKACSPDIVMMDISMPGMDGLATIQEMRRTGKVSRYIIVTSYTSFDYARQALRIGVEDFILKPADIAEIKATFQKVKDSLEFERRSEIDSHALERQLSEVKPVIRSDVVRMAMDGKGNGRFGPMLEFLGIESKCAFVFILQYRGLDLDQARVIANKLRQSGLESLYTRKDRDTVVFIVVGTRVATARLDISVPRFISLVLEKQCVEDFKIGAGTVIENMECLSASYKAAYHDFYAKSLGLSIGKFGDDHGIVGLVNAIAEKILDLDQEGLKNEIEKYILHISEMGGTDSDKNREYVNHSIILIKQKVSEKSLSYKFMDQDLARQFATDGGIEQLRQGMELELSNLLDEIAYRRGSLETALPLVALSYIRENFYKAIGLEDLAEHLKVSTFHASRLIKQAAGKNISELITQLRIEKAKSLLEAGEQSIKEITYEVGLNSQHYFARIFKKYTGLTPSEYQAGIPREK